MTQILPRQPPVGPGHVENEGEHDRPLNVLEEGVPQPDVFVRAVDQPRNVRHRDPRIIGVLHHADHRMQCGEGVGRHLGPRRGNRTQQRRLARVGVAHQPDVGDGLEFEQKFALFARFARLPLARRPVGPGDEARIAPAAPAAGRDDHLFAVLLHIAENLPGGAVGDHGADRNFEDYVRRLAPVHVGAFPARAVLRLVVAVVDESDEALFAVGRLEDDVAAGTAVAAVRTAARHKFFTVKAAAAVAAVAGFDRDDRFIHKHGFSSGFPLNCQR